MSLPPDTPQGIADALEYLQYYLQELTERQHASENSINTTLAALTVQLQQLTQLVANPSLPAIPNTSPPSIPSSLVSPSPAPTVRRTRPKLSCPPDFNGDHAAKWSENVFRQEADTGIFPIQTWGEFKQQFRLHFFSANAEADVINALEGTSYYQGNRMVNDYLDSFQALVSDAGYTDPRTLVVKFRRDLRVGIQNQIATMPYGRPADTDPDAWYNAAWRIDQAHLVNEAFQSVSRSAPSAALKTISAQPPPLSVARLPLAPPPPVTPKPLPTTPSMGVPMDMDVARKARSLPPRGCYQCRNANHVV